jgi:cell filamentation protein
MAGLRKEEYFAAVRAGMDLDFQPMTRLFVDIIELSS